MFQLLAAIGIVAVSMTVCLPAIPAPRESEDDGPINIHAFRCRPESAGTDVEVEVEVREILVDLDMECLHFTPIEDGWYEFAVTTDPNHTNSQSLVRIASRIPSDIRLRIL